MTSAAPTIVRMIPAMSEEPARPQGSWQPLPTTISQTRAGAAVHHYAKERRITTIPTEPEARHDYFVALGRTGGAATFAKYGANHYVTLGKQGFATTLGRYGGDFVWRLLRASYLRKYTDRTGPRRRTTAKAREKGRLRAECRRLYPTAQPCVDCGAPGTQRDHIRGVVAGNGPENVAWRCDRCHAAKTRAERLARWGRKEDVERAIAC